MRLLQFMFLAFTAFRRAEKVHKPQYFAIERHGVPDLCFFIATGREAWRISQRAIEEFQKGGIPR